MSNTADLWHLDVIANTDRLVGVAMHHLADANAARWLVHGVMLGAMTDMLAPANNRDLDSALCHALHAYPANAA